MKKLLQIILGIAVGLLCVEFLFYLKDNGAFPHVNVYVEDDELGVRLEPNSSEYMSIHDNPRFHLRVNAQGYRGGEFPSPSPDEILVVGDSQAFGLGVEEDETFSALLAQKTGRTVINAGVPTYGPPEYRAVAEELIKKRKPKTLIYSINFVNDLFEHNHPNTLRHIEWDGWAVRYETAPASIWWFPGRTFFFQKSHAVYALRRFLWSQQEKRNLELPSEGSWDDLILFHERIDSDLESPEIRQELKALQNELLSVRDDIQDRFENAQEELTSEERRLLKASTAQLGDVVDIVNDRYLEEGRTISATASMIQEGIRFRSQFLERLRTKNKVQWELLQQKVIHEEDLIKKKRMLVAKWSRMRDISSALNTELKLLDTLCREYNVELMVLLLPIDVQVSDTEWEKYNVAPLDMSSSLVVMDDVVRDVTRLGHRYANPLERLRKIQPDGFLNGDIHMDSKGHEAVAEVLVESLKKAIPPPNPTHGIPEGRTWIPSQEEWGIARMNPIFGTNCRWSSISEWVQIMCRYSMIPTEIRNISGDHGEATVLITEDYAQLITPVFLDSPFFATFYTENHNQEIHIQRLDNPYPLFELSSGEKRLGGKKRILNPNFERYCSCSLASYDAQGCEDIGLSRISGSCPLSCVGLMATHLDKCSSHTLSCSDLIECVQARPWAILSCPEGQVNAGGNGICLRLCDENNPCIDGSCHPWQDTGVCW